MDWMEVRTSIKACETPWSNDLDIYTQMNTIRGAYRYNYRLSIGVEPLSPSANSLSSKNKTSLCSRFPPYSGRPSCSPRSSPTSPSENRCYFFTDWIPSPSSTVIPSLLFLLSALISFFFGNLLAVDPPRRDIGVSCLIISISCTMISTLVLMAPKEKAAKYCHESFNIPSHFMI